MFNPEISVRIRGFTLVELMIVVIIIGILAAWAYPTYRQYSFDSRRTDGQRALLSVAALQEKFFAQCRSYTANTGGAMNTCTGLGLPNNLSNERYYQLGIVAGATGNISTSFALTATPQEKQTGDSDCMNLTLDSIGVKGQSGPNTRGRCWRR